MRTSGRNVINFSPEYLSPDFKREKDFLFLIVKERKIKHLRYARDNARVRIYKVIIEEEKRERERWKLGNVEER